MRVHWPIALVAMIAPSAAHAWSHQGHMTTGAIAYDDLAARDPRIVEAVIAIMAAHPDAARFQRNLGTLTGAVRARETFKYMARWPDDVRETPGDRPEWHYALRIVSSWKILRSNEDGDARQGFAQSLATASDPSARPADRAVALCWLFHIVGDIQQPLHAGHWASLGFPMTDRGATLSMVRANASAAAVDLHQYWDDILDAAGNESAAADAHARRLAMRWPRAALPELTRPLAFGVWADESARLAFNTAYTLEGLEAASLFGGQPVVSVRYARIARHLSSRRIAGGGYRIADVLRAVITPAPPP